MMFWAAQRFGLAAALAVIAGLLGVFASSAHAASSARIQPLARVKPADTGAVGAVSVQGAHLLRDGVAWIPRGVQIVGLVAPQGSLTAKYVAAHANFGAGELEAAIADDADTIRFQVSQYGLDPDDPLYSPAYVQEVADAVELARSLGLSVIVSLQAEAPAGEPNGCPLPDVGAARAWNVLAPMFAADPGVMFELYNEPSLEPGPLNWQMWANGGLRVQSDGNVCQEVGMQALIDEIRSDGAGNVIIVPGLGGESTLAGMPPLIDPADPADPQLAYGIHYPSLTGGSTMWDHEFGNVSASAPVIVTEWYATSTHGCNPNEPAQVAWLLDYLASKQIGIVGYAFDVPGTIVADFSYTPTTYANFACGVGDAGPGQLLFSEFAGLAQAADGPAQPDPAWIVSYAELQRLSALAPVLTRHFFDTPRTFVTGASAAALQRLGLPAAVPTTSFDNETLLARAVNLHQLPSGTRAVLYDDEHWRLTPRAQQLHPALYYRLAAQAAHKQDLMLVATPATDLVAAIARNTPTRKTFSEFLKLRIAAGAARYADVYDVQAQSTETSSSAYASFVRAAAAQATAAHPGVVSLAGLSSNPQGSRATSTQLVNAVLATQSLVGGYWLNDPARGTACPTCTGPYPGVMVAMLRALQNDGI